MSPPRRRPTAADVARRSGVSPATVSYVLNQTQGQSIPDATKERVCAAAAELGYVQHAAARTLAKGVSRVVIIDMSSVVQGAFAESGARILSKDIESMGYVPLVSWSTSGLDSERLLSLARATSPVAVLTALPLEDATRDALLSAGVRAVASLVPPGDDVDFIAALPAATQIDRLAAQGHRSILYVAPSPGPLDMVAAARSAALERVASGHGIGFAGLTAPPTMEALATALELSLTRNRDISAIAAHNDDIAMRVIAALHRLGKRVPHDVAVIGVDDLSLAEATVPALTTVRYQFDVAMPTETYLQELLDAGQTSGAAPSIAQSIRTQLVVRDSA